jgi:hypothetical protein
MPVMPIPAARQSLRAVSVTVFTRPFSTRHASYCGTPANLARAEVLVPLRSICDTNAALMRVSSCASGRLPLAIVMPLWHIYAMNDELTEKVLRDYFRVQLAQRAAREGMRLVEEFPVGEARIDFALIGERLEGFELKSDRDDLHRLERQIPAYGLVFDRVTLVTGSRWAATARCVVPRWWGVTAVSAQGCAWRPWSLGVALQNPARDTAKLLELLRREEILAVARETGTPAPRARTTCPQLRRAVLTHAKPESLIAETMRQLLWRERPLPPVSRPGKSLQTPVRIALVNS